MIGFLSPILQEWMRERNNILYRYSVKTTQKTFWKVGKHYWLKDLQNYLYRTLLPLTRECFSFIYGIKKNPFLHSRNLLVYTNEDIPLSAGLNDLLDGVLWFLGELVMTLNYVLLLIFIILDRSTVSVKTSF